MLLCGVRVIISSGKGGQEFYWVIENHLVKGLRRERKEKTLTKHPLKVYKFRYWFICWILLFFDITHILTQIKKILKFEAYFQSKFMTWEIFSLVCSVLPPVKNKLFLVKHYVLNVFLCRCLCELASQIGFTDGAPSIFTLHQQLSTFRHVVSSFIICNVDKYLILCQNFLFWKLKKQCFRRNKQMNVKEFVMFVRHHCSSE